MNIYNLKDKNKMELSIKFSVIMKERPDLRKPGRSFDFKKTNLCVLQLC